MATPVSYPFEPVIAASKQLLYGVRPEPLRLLWLHIDQSKLYAVMIGSLPSFTSLKYS